MTATAASKLRGCGCKGFSFQVLKEFIGDFETNIRPNGSLTDEQTAGQLVCYYQITQEHLQGISSMQIFSHMNGFACYPEKPSVCRAANQLSERDPPAGGSMISGMVYSAAAFSQRVVRLTCRTMRAHLDAPPPTDLQRTYASCTGPQTSHPSEVMFWPFDNYIN